MKKLIVLLCVAGCLVGNILTSCNKKAKEKPLLRVFDNYLYPSDIEGLVSGNVSAEDSIAIIDNYINQWILQMVVLDKAENNINKRFEKELQDYKNSLITYEYEQSIVKQLLDTNVGDNEIQQYYERNKENFTLKNNIVRMVYVKIEKDSPSLSKIKKLMFTNKEFTEEVVVDIQKLASIHAEEYFFDTEVWLPFSDFQRIVPVETYNEEMYIKQNRQISISDDSCTYLARILEFKIVDDISPLSFEYSNIKNIILNKRKIEIIERMQRDLLRTAEIDNNIEYFFDRNKNTDTKKKVVDTTAVNKDGGVVKEQQKEQKDTPS